MSLQLAADTFVVGAGGPQQLAGAADPSAGAGVAAPLGSIYQRTNGELWHKTLAADTGWQQVGTPGASSNLWSAPAVPNALDYEIESTTLDPNWAVFNPAAGTFDFTTQIDPYSAFAVDPALFRLHTNYRPSWLMMQPPNNTQGYGIFRDIGVVPADLLVWARLSFAYRGTNSIAPNDASIALKWCADDGVGDPDEGNLVQVFLNFGTVSEIRTVSAEVTATVFSEIRDTSDLEFNAVFNGYVAIQKIGTTYHFWAAPGGEGTWYYMGSHTTATVLDKIWIAANNNLNSAPGNMVMGVDFVRFRAGRTLP